MGVRLVFEWRVCIGVAIQAIASCARSTVMAAAVPVEMRPAQFQQLEPHPGYGYAVIREGTQPAATRCVQGALLIMSPHVRQQLVNEVLA